MELLKESLYSRRMESWRVDHSPSGWSHTQKYARTAQTNNKTKFEGTAGKSGRNYGEVLGRNMIETHCMKLSKKWVQFFKRRSGLSLTEWTSRCCPLSQLTRKGHLKTVTESQLLSMRKEGLQSQPRERAQPRCGRFQTTSVL